MSLSKINTFSRILERARISPNKFCRHYCAITSVSRNSKFSEHVYRQIWMPAGTHNSLWKNAFSSSAMKYQKPQEQEKVSIVPEEQVKDTSSNSKRSQLKKAIKEYGSTVIVFHVAISLASLGIVYLLVSSGLDIVALLRHLHVGERILESKITTGASTFVIAYAVHKVFAPVRITITLTSAPFIVRYLRNIGFLKTPK